MDSSNKIIFIAELIGTFVLVVGATGSIVYDEMLGGIYGIGFIAAGDPLSYGGINSIGLKRRGFSLEALANIKKAYRKYFRSDLPRSIALEKMKKEMVNSTEIEEIINFIETSKRGII